MMAGMRCLVWLLLVLGMACGVGDGRAAVGTFLGGTSVQEFATTVTPASGGWRYAGYDRYAATGRGGVFSEYGTYVAVAMGGVISPRSAMEGAVVPASAVPRVHIARGVDMGGGVGGLLYTERPGTDGLRIHGADARGDVVSQLDRNGEVRWASSYAAYGTRVQEASAGGAPADRFRANSKEEDPTGLLNEGFRYRDLETGTFISRDPLGFVDGPNVYCYVGQNPWSAFDPEGLAVPRDRDQAQRHQDAILGAYDTAHEYMGRAIEVMSQGMRDGSRRTGEAWFEKAEFYYQAASYMSVELEVYERYRDAHGNCSDGVPNWWDPGCLGECTPEQIADTTYQARQTGAIGDSAIIQPTSLMETDMTFKFLDAGLTVSGVGAGVKALSAVSRKLFAGIGKAAANSARGLSQHGGVFSETVLENGSSLWTSTGRIAQKDFAPLVNGGLYKGSGQVDILSGVHGLPDGSMRAGLDLFHADVKAFGNIPGVQVHNILDMSPAQIGELIRNPNTTIGGFCDSEAVLSLFR
jgi:RHS repeat-associated protein